MKKEMSRIIVVLFLLSFTVVSIHSGLVQRPTAYVWPPQEYINRVNDFSPYCRAQTGVKQESIETFSDSDDFDNLPSNREFQCYLNCLFIQTNVTARGSLKLDVASLMTELNGLPEYTHKIILNMFKKCLKKPYVTNDACEKSYLFHVCLKQTDIEHYVIM